MCAHVPFVLETVGVSVYSIVNRTCYDWIASSLTKRQILILNFDEWTASDEKAQVHTYAYYISGESLGEGLTRCVVWRDRCVWVS